MPARGLGGLGLGGVWWRGLKAVYRGKKTGWDTHAKARRREGRRRGMRAWSCEVGAGGGCRRWDRVPTGRWFFGERLPGILSRAEELRTCGASTKRPSGTGKKGHRGRWWIGFGGEGFGRWGEFKSGAARCFHRTPRCWRAGWAGSVWVGFGANRVVGLAPKVKSGRGVASLQDAGFWGTVTRDFIPG